eukprot:GSChrysophyteH1.ASY1.ANO1.2570.1 assembled CDS
MTLLLSFRAGFRGIARSFSSDVRSSSKLPVIFVLGGPGSGKGTQCARFSKENEGVYHISAGELLRKEVTGDSSCGSLIESILKDGRIIPSHITMSLLKDEIMECINHGATCILIDGYPRNEENLLQWNSSSIDNFCNISGCLYIRVPDEELAQRLILRGRSSGRSDDKIEAIQKRLVVHHSETLSLLSSLKRKHLLVQINGNQTVAEVGKEFEKYVKSCFRS